jgi:lysozyme
MEALNREILLVELSRDEGDRFKVYIDTEGHPSVGTGRNLDARKGGLLGISPSETLTLRITRASVIKNGITNAQRIVLLNNDVNDCLRDLDRALPWWRSMDGVRQRVLVNMCFNMGIGTLLGFKNTLRFMETKQWAAAAHGMMVSKWARQVGDRAERLSTLMIQGERKL